MPRRLDRLYKNHFEIVGNGSDESKQAPIEVYAGILLVGLARKFDSMFLFRRVPLRCC